MHEKANTLQDTRSDDPIVEIDFTAEKARLTDLQVNEVSGLEEEEDCGEGMEEEHCILVEVDEGGEEVEDAEVEDDGEVQEDAEKEMEDGDEVVEGDEEEVEGDEEEVEEDEEEVGDNEEEVEGMRRRWRGMIYRQSGSSFH